MARAPASAAPAVFLDRDGVLNADHGYVYQPTDLQLLPGVPGALNLLKASGFRLIVVSNQSGVARGYFSCEDVERFHAHMQSALLARGGVGIDAYYYCPFHPQGSVPAFTATSPLRKPAPGMVLLAAKEHGLDLAACYLVGDKYDDVACAEAAGVTGIQVRQSGQSEHPAAAAVVADLAEAAAWIAARRPRT